MDKIYMDKNSINLIISENINNRLISLIQKDGFERAGILIGYIYPTSNTIIIKKVIEAEYVYQDKFNVEINNQLMQEKMTKIWEHDNYMTYLGHFHTHVENNPTPSSIDIETMSDNFINGKYALDFLIEIIIGRETNFIKLYDGNKFYDIEVKYEL